MTAGLPELSVTRPALAGPAAGGGRAPLVRWLRALAARPWLVLSAIVLAAAGVAIAFSVHVTGYEPDEIPYTRLAIAIAHAHTPITLEYLGSQRLNQLYPLLIAPLWGLFANPTAFRLTHLWSPLLMASAAIPTYLLARAVVRERWAAYLAAALVALAPWLTLSTSELTENAAYPACAWALLAMQRTLAVPSPRRDLLALAAIALAGYGRLQLAALAPLLVVAMLVHELGYALVAGRRDRRGALRAAGARIVRQHAPLSALGVLGVLVGLPLLLSGKLSSALGFYGDTVGHVTLDGATFDLARSYLVFIALGLAALPTALALGFAGEALFAPVSRVAHAFAALSVVTILGLTLQVAEVGVRFNGSTVQERYLIYIVPLLAVGMCAALLLSRRPARTALGGTLVLAALLATTHNQSPRTPVWYQISPGMTTFYDWIGPLFGASGAPSADPGASSQALAGAVVLALGLLVAACARLLPAPRVLAALAATAIVFCAVETVHALSHVVNGSAGGHGLSTASLHDVDWIDRGVPAGATVEQVVSEVGSRDEAFVVWEQTEFWNRSIASAYTFEAFADPNLPTTSLAVAQASGAIVLAHAAGARTRTSTPPASPRYLVVPTQGFPVELQGATLARSPDGTLALIRPAAPLRAAWAVSGVPASGWLALGRPATLRLYTLRGAPGRCATVAVTLALSSLTSSARTLALGGSGGAAQAVQFAPGQTRTVERRVCAHGREAPALTLSNRQSPAATDPQLTLQLRRVTVTPA